MEHMNKAEMKATVASLLEQVRQASDAAIDAGAIGAGPIEHALGILRAYQTAWHLHLLETAMGSSGQSSASQARLRSGPRSGSLPAFGLNQSDPDDSGTVH